MAVYYLENDRLYAEISSHGAELIRLMGKKDKREYLFDADPRYWKRHSPVLFPVVGGLKDKKYRYADKEYTLAQHGFARDMEFDPVEISDNTVRMELKPNDFTRENYPFEFVLTISYVLTENTLEVFWNVENRGDNTMYFSIGAHPAFYCRLTGKEEEFSDRIHVGQNLSGTFESYTVSDNGYALPEIRTVYPRDLKLTQQLFLIDALIVDNEQAKRLAIADSSGEEYVVMNFDAPLFGIWAPKGECPFVCLEPWYGRCDSEDFTGTLEEREYGSSLEVGGRFDASYTITLPLE